MNLKVDLKATKNYVINTRRKLHEMPEVSGKEIKTRDYIKNEMKKYGLQIDEVNGTGIVGVLETGIPGPNIALRADMDALPIKENECNLVQKRTCISKNEHISHLCGHDAHMSMLLGTMDVLIKNKEKLSGNIYFCFEEGEECGCGIESMIDYLSDKSIDTVWGIHVYSNLESGKVSVDEGPRMSGAIGVDFKFIGKGGHGSRPDLSINPVFCAANFLNNLAVAFANQIEANETVTLGITSISADESTKAGNVIGDSANVIGSMRFFDMEEGRKALEIYKRVAESTGIINNCKVEFGPMSAILSKPVINDSEYSKLARESIGKMIGKENVVKCEKWYGSETFSRYTEEYKSVFCFLGIKNPQKGSGAEHHNEYFDVDEEALIRGVESTLAYVVGFLEKYNEDSLGGENEK